MLIYSLFGSYIGLCRQTLGYASGKTRGEVIEKLLAMI